MTVVANIYIDNLCNIVCKYINAYHRTIKIKPIDVVASTYVKLCVGNIYKVLLFKAGDHM